jgi:hypothetical protein
VALQRRCRASTLAGVGGARDEDLVGAAGQPGHDLGDPGGVAWGRSLGRRPIWATATVKRPFGEPGPALRVARRPPGEWRRARALPARGKTSRSAAVSVGRWDILLGQRRVPPYAAHRRFKKVVNSQRTTKARRPYSLPLLAYSRLGGLRQDPGRAAESAAGPRTDEDMGARRACVVVELWGTRRQPLVGLAMRLRALGVEVRVCAPPDWAERPDDSSEGRQREMRTCPTRGSTELEAPVIRSASAVQRSTAASEVSR